ncbi:hypothetical protein GUA40_24465, partial [Vibrio parahaemolyticus]|nr:hypothetical protein [Vibrio parahaemolyticus]
MACVNQNSVRGKSITKIKKEVFLSGQDGNRGYLVQSIIGLLESLKETGWSKVTIEADHISDKVDVAWHGKDRVKVSQVKSSINQISKANALKWAIELEESCQADEY